MLHKAMLYGIEVDVIHVGRVIAVVADCVFPIAALPDAAFTAVSHDFRAGLADGEGF